MIFLFLLILLFSFTPSSVLADDFNIIGDSNLNFYRQATAISIGDIPEFVQGSFKIEYDTNLVQGITTQDVLENGAIQDISTMGYLRRIPEIGEEVSAPPGTKIDIVYFYFNQAGHNVDVSKVVIPFSRSNLINGNWLNVVSVNEPLPVVRNISVFFDYRNLTKKGLLKEYMGPGVLEHEQRGFFVIDTITISQDIVVVNLDIEEMENQVKITVEVQNVGELNLENIYYEHNAFSFEFSIDSQEVVSIEYVLEDIADYGNFKIFNPNSKTECAIFGNPVYNWIVMEAVTVMGFREDGGWVNGAYVSPQQESFCISQIPYTLISPHLGYANVVDDDNIEEEEDLEESKVFLEKQEPEEVAIVSVLGIEDTNERESSPQKVDFVLPKTGVVRY